MSNSALFFDVLKQVESVPAIKKHLHPVLSRGHLYSVGLISDEAFVTVEQTLRGSPKIGDVIFLPSKVTVVYTESVAVDQLDGSPDRVIPLIMVGEMLENGMLGLFSFVGSENGGAGLGLALVYGPNDLRNVKPTRGPGSLFVDIDTLSEGQKTTYSQMAGIFLSCLVAINTTGTTVRRQWGPKERRSAKGFRGAYFNGYTEVKIKNRVVSEPSSHPSGVHKCLHYVRAHRRVYKSGRVVVVPEHWRGDPKLGVKDHRYKVEK